MDYLIVWYIYIGTVIVSSICAFIAAKNDRDEVGFLYLSDVIKLLILVIIPLLNTTLIVAFFVASTKNFEYIKIFKKEE